MADVIDRALLTHAQIIGMLKTAILAADATKAEYIQSDRLCEFGQWIYGGGGRPHFSVPAFAAMRKTHRDLHNAAFDAFCHCRDGRKTLACDSIENGEFRRLAEEMKSRLLDLKRAIRA